MLMASWKFKVVLSGTIDVLRLCWSTKCQLEKDLTLDQVAAEIAKLRRKLEGFCEKNSVAAHALAGAGAASAGTTLLEACCEDYRANRDKKLLIQYTIAGERVQRQVWIPINDLGDRDEVKATFRIVKAS